MRGYSFTWLRIAAVIVFATQVSGAVQCYYPNGNAAPDTEKPCSSTLDSACCPSTWECLDNGLCHLPVGNLYGRYSCTDKDWKSPGCASNLCTYGMTLGGGESITQCSDHNDNWCCNGDAQHVNCCKESPSPRPFFALQAGKAYATIGVNQAVNNPTLSSITGLASGIVSSSLLSRTAGSRSLSESPTSATPFNSFQTSLSSGPAGVQTIIITALISPTAAPNNGASKSTSGSNPTVGIIVGCALGIPLAISLAGIVFWILRKRRQEKVHPYMETSDIDGDLPSSPDSVRVVAPSFRKNQSYRRSPPGMTEIDSQPVGPGRPISAIRGFAELESGTAFKPGCGTPYGPDTVGLGGGNGHSRSSSWGSVPPQYSPRINQVAFGHRRNRSGMDSASALPVIDEKEESKRQSRAVLQPESYGQIAELSAVKTPQEDAEKQLYG